MDNQEKREVLREALAQMMFMLESRGLDLADPEVPEWIADLEVEVGKVRMSKDGSAKVTLTFLPEDLAKKSKNERDMMPEVRYEVGEGLYVTTADIGREVETKTVGKMKFLGFKKSHRKYPWLFKSSTSSTIYKTTTEGMLRFVRAWRANA